MLNEIQTGTARSTQFEIGRTVGKGLVGLALAALTNSLEFNGQEVYKEVDLLYVSSRG